MRDLDLVTEAARGCDVVFHLAAGAGVVESMNDPLTNFDQNARGTLTVLEAARRAEVPRFVFSSSNAPLGENAYPASEEKPVAPLSPYGASKAAGEAYCSAFFGAYGMEAVVVRFRTRTAPARRTRATSSRSSSAGCVRARTSSSSATAARRATSSTARTWRPDSSPRARTPGVGGQIFQLASGIETTLNRLLELLSETSGITPRVRREPPRQGEIQRNYSLIEKARDVSATRPRSTWSTACGAPGTGSLISEVPGTARGARHLAYY